MSDPGAAGATVQGRLGRRDQRLDQGPEKGPEPVTDQPRRQGRPRHGGSLRRSPGTKPVAEDLLLQCLLRVCLPRLREGTIPVDRFTATPERLRENRGFLRRITMATAWGEGLDGYDLGIISVVVTLISQELGISAGWLGLIGASSLIGIFFGGPIFGYLTDRFGRRRMFTFDILLFLVAGLLQAVVGAGWQLFVVRLVLGVAIGAEYAI